MSIFDTNIPFAGPPCQKGPMEARVSEGYNKGMVIIPFAYVIDFRSLCPLSALRGTYERRAANRD